MVKRILTPWLLPSCITTRHSKGYRNTLRIATLEEILHKLLRSISTLPLRQDRVNGIEVDQMRQARFHHMHITKPKVLEVRNPFMMGRDLIQRLV